MFVWPWPPLGDAFFKHQAEDFQVEEVLPFALSGEGEHLWLWVEKRDQNTEWVARQLARWADIPVRHVGYAGLKDRRAVTRQWFSLWLPGSADPDAPLALEGVRVLRLARHQRKLQVGALSANRFQIVLRQVTASQDAVAARLRQIERMGFPNYFGPQRFGRDGENLRQAHSWVAAGCPRVRPAVRSRHLSVLRAQVFNAVLAKRIGQDSWHRCLTGEVLQLDGSDRCFVDDGSPGLIRRVEAGDLHPTGPLPGEGGLHPLEDAAMIERAVLADFDWLQPVWRKWRMRQARRALRVLPRQLTWRWLDARTLCLRFTLPAGGYATSLLGAVFALRDAQ